MRPARDEAQALADECPTCGEKTEPGWVQDAPSGNRLATYTHCTGWQGLWDTGTGATPRPVTRYTAGRTSQITPRLSPPVRTLHGDLLCSDCGAPHDALHTHSRCAALEAS